MPGLIHGVARTAAVVGTANAVSTSSSRSTPPKDQQAAQAAAYQQQQYAPPPSRSTPRRPPSGCGDPTVTRSTLAALHAQGILSDEEFASAKAKALGI